MGGKRSVKTERDKWKRERHRESTRRGAGDMQLRRRHNTNHTKNGRERCKKKKRGVTECCRPFLWPERSHEALQGLSPYSGHGPHPYPNKMCVGVHLSLWGGRPVNAMVDRQGIALLQRARFRPRAPATGLVPQLRVRRVEGGAGASWLCARHGLMLQGAGNPLNGPWRRYSWLLECGDEGPIEGERAGAERRRRKTGGQSERERKDQTGREAELRYK